MNLTPRQYLHEVGYSKIGKIGCGFCGPYVSGLQCADTLREPVDHKLGLSIGYIQAFKCFSFLLFLIIITDKPYRILQSLDSDFGSCLFPTTHLGGARCTQPRRVAAMSVWHLARTCLDLGPKSFLGYSQIMALKNMRILRLKSNEIHGDLGKPLFFKAPLGVGEYLKS